jgi:hypothetical protein
MQPAGFDFSRARFFIDICFIPAFFCAIIIGEEQI